MSSERTEKLRAGDQCASARSPSSPKCFMRSQKRAAVLAGRLLEKLSFKAAKELARQERRPLPAHSIDRRHRPGMRDGPVGRRVRYRRRQRNRGSGQAASHVPRSTSATSWPGSSPTPTTTSATSFRIIRSPARRSVGRRRHRVDRPTHRAMRLPKSCGRRESEPSYARRSAGVRARAVVDGFDSEAKWLWAAGLEARTAPGWADSLRTNRFPRIHPRLNPLASVQRKRERHGRSVPLHRRPGPKVPVRVETRSHVVRLEPGAGCVYCLEPTRRLLRNEQRDDARQPAPNQLRQCWDGLQEKSGLVGSQVGSCSPAKPRRRW
jgi:hypothetical protein